LGRNREKEIKEKSFGAAQQTDCEPRTFLL